MLHYDYDESQRRATNEWKREIQKATNEAGRKIGEQRVKWVGGSKSVLGLLEQLLRYP